MIAGGARVRWLGLLLLAQALLALEVDPYHAHRAAGGLELPGRGKLLALIAAELVAGVVLQSRAGRAAVLQGAALLFAPAVLLLSCPFGSSWSHALQCALVAGAAVLALAEVAEARAALPSALRRGLVAALAALCLLLGLEGAFSFVARSHAVGYTLAARLWFERYWWGRANALGYRDFEQVEDGRPKLFVLGDSFVSGVGVRDPDQRFSDLLAARLGGRYQVHNLGWNGADTLEELERLRMHPARPDVVVLAYYVNDVQGAGVEHGLALPPFRPYANLPRLLVPLVSRSYALDYLYWRLPQEDLAVQAGLLARCFASPEVVATHEEHLQRLLDACRERGAAVVAVAFPPLDGDPASARWLEPALRVFARNAVPAVDVRKLLVGLAARDVTVNANDAHPNERLHALVADALAPLVLALPQPPAPARSEGAR